jgi:hypothetical protein
VPTVLDRIRSCQPVCDGFSGLDITVLIVVGSAALALAAGSVGLAFGRLVRGVSSCVSSRAVRRHKNRTTD